MRSRYYKKAFESFPALPKEPPLQVVVLPALADDLLTYQLLSGNDDVAPDVHLEDQNLTIRSILYNSMMDPKGFQ